jgi:hypothetical protein
MKLQISSRSAGKVIPVTPKFLLKKEAMKYVGLERKVFDNGLSVYAYGRNKVWYKVSELDELIESFLIIKRSRSYNSATSFFSLLPYLLLSHTLVQLEIPL